MLTRSRRGTTVRNRLRVGLVMISLASCSSRERTSASAAGNDPGVVASGAVPVIADPSADASTTQAPACVMGTPVRLAPPDAHVIGIWYDAGQHLVRIATTPNPHEVHEATFSPTTGALAADRTITLAPDASAEAAWRAASGDTMLSVRSAGSLHLMRVSPTGLDEVTISRYLEPTSDVRLGPLDDASDSQLIGLVATNTSVTWNTTYLCVTETVSATAHPESCLMYVQPETSLHHVGAVYAGHRFVVHVRGLGAMPQPMLGEETGPFDSFSPTALGRGSYTVRRAQSDVERGAPRLAMSTSGGVVAWVETGGPLEVQRFGTSGSVTEDPLSLPFVDAALKDLAADEHEIDVTLVTRADRSASPTTTTFVRLTPGLRAEAPLVATPVRVPIANATMLRLGAGNLLFVSETDALAMTVRCGG